MPSIALPVSFRTVRRAGTLLPFLCLLALPVQAQDADGDGLSDVFEAQIGTNPALADTDSDGDDDWLEYYRCRSPISAADRGPHRCSLGSAADAPPAERGVAWSENGPIAGMDCTRIAGGSDAAQWPNTYLCTRPYMGFRWSTTGPIAGMSCVSFRNGSDPAWSDGTNYLCRAFGPGTTFHRFPSDAFFWASSPTPPTNPAGCARITNANKASGWDNVFFCFTDTTTTFDAATCTNCDLDDVSGGPILQFREADIDDVASVIASPAGAAVSGHACTRLTVDPTRCRLPAEPFAELGGRHLVTDNSRWTVAFAFPAPRIDAVTPSAGVLPGTMLTLDGVRFGYGTPEVTVGGLPCTIQPPVRNTRLQCRMSLVPLASAGSASVSVRVGGQSSDTRTISVVPPPPPTIDTVQPLGAVPTQGGGVLRVTGTHFDVHPITIQVGGAACPLIAEAASATEQQCTIPAGQGEMVAVAVIVGPLRRDTTLDYDAPVIDGIEGEGGPTAGGTRIRLVGRNFGNGASFTAVVGDSICSPVLSVGHLQAECTLPSGRGAAVPVRVTVAGQTSEPRAYRYGAPVVIGVAGQGGATPGGSLITIDGGNFGVETQGLAVTIGGRPCGLAGAGAGVTHGRITCTLPAGQGGAESVRVEVAGQASNSDITYAYAAPVIASFSGAGGPTAGGTLLTLQGSHFGADRGAFTATIDGRACVLPDDAPFSHTGTQCLLPPGEGATATLRLLVGGQTSNPLPYAYAPPRIDSVLGQDGPTSGGTEVTLRGANFGLGGAGFAATIGGNPCTVTTDVASTHTEARCTLPEGQGAAVPVRVAVAGQQSNTLTYRYGAPRVDSVQGMDGPTAGGVPITIIGANFGPGGQGLLATVAGNACVPVLGSSPMHTRLQCVLPPGEGANAPLQVSLEGRSSNTFDYRYGAPRIDTVQGQDGPTAGGTLVTLTGANFGRGAGAFSVTIGDRECTRGAGGSVDHTEVRCSLPEGQGAAVPVSMRVAGQSSNMRSYRYGAPVAAVATGTLLRTAGGEVLEIVGSNLGTSGTVTVDGASCGTIDHDHARIRCTAPPGSGPAQPVVVDIGGQQANLLVAYRAPSITAASPISGPTAGGGVLTIDGSDFGATALSRPRLVELGGSPCPLLSASHTRITCELPAGEGVGRALRVVVDGQPSNTLAFSYLPPRLVDLSPGAMPLQGGLDLEIIGDNLGLAPSVTIDAAPCPLLPGAGTHQRVRCRPPARASGVGQVRLVVGGQVSNVLGLDYDEAPVVVAIAKAGTGAGSVIANRLGLGCDATCLARDGLVPSGAQVQLEAVAEPGSRFMRWQGACTGSAAQCTFEAVADSTVVAVFDDLLFGSGFEAGESP